METSSGDSPLSRTLDHPAIPLMTGRLFIALATLVTVLLLAPYQAIMVFVVLGHGHINLTYLDHFKKGRYSPKGPILFFVTLLAAFAALNLNMGYFILFVSIFFVLHNFFDDMRLLGDQNRFLAILSTAPLFTFMCLASSDSILGTGVLPVAALPLLLTFIPIAAFLALRNTSRSSPYIVYTLGISSLLMVIYQIIPDMGPERFFAFIILSHYFNWYWHIYKKIDSSAIAQRRIYVRDCVMANVFFIAVFIGFITVYGGAEEAVTNPVFTLFYTPYNFYVWTLMHLLVTFRREDYGFPARL